MATVESIEPVAGGDELCRVALAVETRNQKGETVIKGSARALLPAGRSRGRPARRVRAIQTQPTKQATRAGRSTALTLAFPILLGTLGIAACLPSLAGWDVAALEAEYPALAEWSGHRLGDATPYFAPQADGIALFLCRWRTDRAILLSLPSDANEPERAALRAALAAWQDAGIGVRFREVSEARAQLVIRFVGGDVIERRAGGSATTSADCALPPELVPPLPGEAWAVELVSARIELQRNNLDVLGRPVALSQEELAGTLLHELGHALGYPSHAAGSSTVMVQSVDRVRRRGRRLLAEGSGGFSAPTLGALYALPTGAVVGKVAIPPASMAEILKLYAIAREAGWGAPLARVGDRWARLWWLDDADRVVGFLIPGIQRGWRPDLRWFPTASAREYLRAAPGRGVEESARSSRALGGSSR